MRVRVASRLTTKAFNKRAAQIGNLQIVDVRNPGEVAAGTIPNAITIPVGQLPTRLGGLDPTVPTVVYCAGGYLVVVAASLLRQNGFTDVGHPGWLRRLGRSHPEHLSDPRTKHHDHHGQTSILIVGGVPVGSHPGSRRVVFQGRDRLGDDVVVAVLDSCDERRQEERCTAPALSTTDDRRRSSGPMVSAT